MIGGAILLASASWAFTFGWAWGNFWIKIGLSVIAVSFYSLLWERPRVSFQLRSFLYGLLSATILYLIFLLAKELTIQILPSANAQVEGIYSLGSGTNRILIFLLLFFITGPGEEIFWRGFLQKSLMDRLGNRAGYLMSTAIYAGVHIFSGNLLLILSAIVAGGFWGLLFLWRKDLLIQITSHSFWSAFIFAVLPIQ